MTMMKLGAARDVREEDFAAGKAWVHPETRIEYEDFGAWLAGEAPLKHWRNDQVAYFLGLRGGPLSDAKGKPVSGYQEARIAEVFAFYDREGNRKHVYRRNSTATYGGYTD